MQREYITGHLIEQKMFNKRELAEWLADLVFPARGFDSFQDFPHRRQVENIVMKGGYVGIPGGTKMPQPLKLRHSSVPEKIWTSDPTLRRKIYTLPCGYLTPLFMLFHVKSVLVEPSLLCLFIAYCTISSTTINFHQISRKLAKAVFRNVD